MPAGFTRWPFALFACLAACTRDNPGRRATRAECDAMHAKLYSLQPAATREAMALLGREHPNEQMLTICQERLTLEVVTCVQKSTSPEAAAECRSSVDIRPASARRSPDECDRYVRHVRGIVEGTDGSVLIANNVTNEARKECAGWLTQARFDCTMNAISPQDWASCPP